MSQFIQLQNQFGLPWQKHGNFYFKGNFQFETIEPTFENATSFLENSFGNFAWIYEDEQKIILCSDTIRSYPLFYFFDGKNFSVSDNAQFLKDKFSAKINPKQVDFFRETGYTCGTETLLENIHCLNAFSMVTYYKNTKTIETQNFPFELGLGLEFQNNEKFESTAQSLFENLIQKLGNKKAIIPLSGGWDSRFILAGLIKHGFKNIVCFTYGKRNSYEVKIAYQIAEKLDVEWHFVEYKPETFNLYLTEEAWQYEVYASQYTSIAYEQDFFAIHQLKNEGKLPESGVFLPGYCGDLLSGSKTINSNVPHSDDDVLKHILNKHFPKKFDNKKQVEELINSSIKKIEAKDYPALSDEFCAAYETWYYHHKSNKFINNGVRCFEFFGYEWIVPFSTYNYVNFWQNVFFDDRDKERYLYKKNLNKLYFEPLEINFENDTTAEKWSSFSDFLKNVTPQQFKKPIKKLLLKNNEQDVNNLMHFGKMLMDNAGIHEDFDDENIAHAKWLLKKLGL